MGNLTVSLNLIKDINNKRLTIDMSLIFSHGNCSLISHEIYLNQIYQNASHSDAASLKYKIRSDLFELNVPYRRQTFNNDKQTKKRQRKIIEKNADRLINEHPDEYALVKYRLKLINFLFNSLILKHLFADCKTQRKHSKISANMSRKRVFA